MANSSSQDRPLTRGNRHRISRRVWCECRLPLHRSSRHLVNSRQRKRHKIACREQRIPFTDAEAELVQAGRTSTVPNQLNETSSDTETDTSDTAPHPHSVNQGQDDDDQPAIADWIHDMIVPSEGDGEEPQVSAYDIQTRALEMFDAFVGTPREKVKKMRQAISKHYCVDIGDPTRTGRALLEDTVGDVVTPKYFDCCADGCVAFTGRLVAASACPSCGKRRYDHTGQPRYRFQYIPLLPRLRLQYCDAARSRQLSSYRATFDPSQPDNGTRTDVFDGAWYQECWSNGHFRDHRDLAIRLTLDAIGTVKHPRRRQNITPVVLYLLNLHPSTREDASNAVTTHIIPGGFDKDFADTWLQPLVTELHELHHGVDAHDGASNQDFVLKAHVILVTGDGPAIADIMGTKSPGKAKRSCRMCTFSGTLGRGGKYFYPNTEYTVTSVNTDLRAYFNEVEQLRSAGARQRDFSNMQRDRGVTCRSILLDLPTIHFPRSFPIDTMHSMNHNIPKSMFRLWKGQKYQQQGQGAEKYPWVIPESDWMLIDYSIAASRATVPTRVGTAPRGTSSFGNWTTHEWRSFFLTYGAPVMQHFLPKQYASNFLRYRQLLHCTDQRYFTLADVNQVDSRARRFVTEYEDLYYGGDPDLLPSCTVQFHFLLHLGQNIRDFGPPAYYAQWSLERFLRTVKRFATATVYKHRSAEVNALTREQRIHARWNNYSHTMVIGDDDIVYADDKALSPTTPELRQRTRRRMEARWQQKLDEADDPLAHWHTGTSPSDLVMYRSLVLPTGARVGTFSSASQSLVSRCTAFVMYYADPAVGSRQATVQLSFGTVVALFMDPADLSQWAGIVRYRRVQPASAENRLPQPRMFDEDDNDMMWVSVDRILDLVGAAQVYYRRGASIAKSLFLVDKYGYSEEDTPQEITELGRSVALVY